MEKQLPRRAMHWRSEAGMTLVETVIALIILFIATAGLMALGVVATMTTENEGHLAARATEYAQDKMEQLISLPFCDNLADTTVFPTTPGGGTGLTIGGSADPDAPVDGYVDYLDADGNPLGGGAVAPANWYYVRVWEVSAPADATNPAAGDCVLPANYCNPHPPSPTACFVKQIMVTTKVRFGVGAERGESLAQSTLTVLKTYPF